MLQQKIGARYVPTLYFYFFKCTNKYYLFLFENCYKQLFQIGWTALHCACVGGFEEVVDMLLCMKGINVNDRDEVLEDILAKNIRNNIYAGKEYTLALCMCEWKH